MRNIYIKSMTALKESNVTSNDSLKEVLKKIGNSPQEIKDFVKSCWCSERCILDKIFKILPKFFNCLDDEKFIPDPGKEYSIEVELPNSDEKLYLCEDFLFKQCPNCKGRLFNTPFCPHCGNKIDIEPEVINLKEDPAIPIFPKIVKKEETEFRDNIQNEILKKLPKRYCIGGGRNMKSKKEKEKLEASSVVFDDGEIKITNYDLAEIDKTIKELGIDLE